MSFMINNLFVLNEDCVMSGEHKESFLRASVVFCVTNFQPSTIPIKAECSIYYKQNLLVAITDWWMILRLAFAKHCY